MKKNNSDVNLLIFEASVLSFIAAFIYYKVCITLSINYDPLNTISLCLLGIIGLVYYFINYNNFSVIFRKTNLGIDGIYPTKISRQKDKDCIIYKFTLPVGLSTNDITKKQVEIEQYLGKRIEITYLYRRTFSIKELDKN